MPTNFRDVKIIDSHYSIFRGIKHLIVSQNNSGEKKFISQLDPYLLYKSKKILVERLEILSSLDHPNIAKINQYIETCYGHTEGLGAEIMMDIIEEVTLDEYIIAYSGPITYHHLVTMFTKIVTAISYLHKRNLIHNNIYSKIVLEIPSSVNESEYDGNIKLICGTSVSSDCNQKMTSRPENNLLYTNRNNFYTPSLVNEEFLFSSQWVDRNHEIKYMSPEESCGDIIDFQSDIYLLGLTLYKMSCGYDPNIDSKGNLSDAREKYIHISPKIIEVINKCTKKNKKERYKSCEELLNDLN